MDLNVNELFTSFSGEVGLIPQGFPITVLRLQGCNLDCPWCDAYTSKDIVRHGVMDTDLLAKMIRHLNWPLLITGGEPLLQSEALSEMLVTLVQKYDWDGTIQIETNGTVPINDFLFGLCNFVVDYKIPFLDRVLYTEILKLKETDYVKILVSCIEDIPKFVEQVGVLKSYSNYKAKISVTTTDPDLYPLICEEILKHHLPIVVNVQIHKTISVR